MTTPLIQMQKLGQSPWHDNIRRGLLTSGALKKMVRAGDITGLTSNPTIFEQAIAQSRDYDTAIETLARAGRNAEQIFDTLSIEDIQAAADVFAPVFKRTKGNDGYVSIEVSPKYAADTKATVKEAHRLWAAVDRPNLMIKIPATQAGIPAIEQAIADGLNVNVTLIFSLQRYAEVMEAYLAGLEKRQRRGKDISHIASVASFFVSRVDSLVDKLLDEKIKLVKNGPFSIQALEALKGQAAIANAKLAYAGFRKVFTTERYTRLARQGARVQRPLWASTSTKNPAYPDVYYIEALIGPDSVDTMPPATIVSYKDHGQPAARIQENLEQATKAIEQLEEFGIQMDWVTQKLEDEGVASFMKSFDGLLGVVEARRLAMLLADRQTLTLGPAQKKVDGTLKQLASVKFGERLWKKDPTLWKPDDEAHQKEIKIRLGWLDVADLMRTKVDEMTTFATEARAAGFTHAVLCGMGGSSLAPEVLRATFGVRGKDSLNRPYVDVRVLDSTDPASVINAEAWSAPDKTLYIIASKSGSTTEPNAFFSFFWSHVHKAKGARAGENFIAITDPGTKMEMVAQAHGFRKIFLNPPEIGGRYSALSFFGLVPAALMGIDVAKLLDRARQMMLACGPHIAPAQNPGLILGATMGALAQAGRDKLTFIMDKKLATFGYWTEQLIAESTGKEGVGIVPVEGEPLGKPAVYGKDRVFVVMSVGKPDKSAKALSKMGHPVIALQLRDLYDLGAEFIRWEIATAAAGWVLGIDPFDQPNVQESKDNTVRLLGEFTATGQLPDPGSAFDAHAPDYPAQLARHLKQVKAGDYIALTAYVERTDRRAKALLELRTALRDKYKVATTVGYGPRFLHSTGQLHKGGANNGVFLQFNCDDPIDAPIHGEKYTFSVLKAAQALGDFESLATRQRRAVRVNLGDNIQAGLLKTLAGLAGQKKRKK